MAIELGSGYVSLIPSAQGFGAAVAKLIGGDVEQAGKDAGAKAGDGLGGSLLNRLKGTGAKVVEALGLAAVGAAAAKAAIDVEEANNTIVRSTGATGAVADRLSKSFENVASSTAASFDVVSKTLAEVFQRTGLQGKALEQLTLQVVTFNRITKDSPITVDALTKSLAGFNIPGAKMGEVLDHLFVISQKTGVPLAEMLDTLQQGGPIARQFGFSVEFTANLLSLLNRAGLDANQVLPGLRKAFVEFAKAGKDPAEGLRDTLTQLEALLKAGDKAGANQLAVQVFGPRGVGLVDAAISGKLSLAEFLAGLNATGDGILATQKKTATLGDALGQLKNNAKLALGEFATPALQAANDALTSILPTVKDLGHEFATLPDPIKISVGSIAGLVALAGPLGNLGQGIGGLTELGKGIATVFQLGAVRALEFAGALKAIGVAQLLAGGAVTVGIAAIGALIVALAGGRGKYEEITDAANKWAAVEIRTATAGNDQRSALNALQLTQSKLKTGIAELVDAQHQNILASQQSRLTIDEANAKNQELAAQILVLQKRYGDLSPKVAELKDALAEQAAQQKTTNDSLKKYNDQVQAGTRSTSDFTGATDDAKKAIQELQSAVLAAAGGDIAREQALLNVARAQDDLGVKTAIREQAERDLAKAVSDSGPGSLAAYLASVALDKAREDEAQSTLDLRSAQLQSAGSADADRKAQDDLVTSLQNVKGAHGDLNTAIDIQIRTLKDKIALDPANAAGYQTEIDKLVDLKAKLDAIAGFVANATVTANTDQAQTSLDALISKFGTLGAAAQAAGIDLGTLTPEEQRQLGLRASGGPIWPGTWLVGEAGPEIVNIGPSGHGFVLNATDTQARFASGDASSSASGARDGRIAEQIHLHVETVARDQVDFAFGSAKELRTAMFLATGVG